MTQRARVRHTFLQRHRRLCEVAAVLLAGLMAAPPVGADGLFARGDADCNIRLSAADVVATARALSGSPGCNNSDCDRNGTLTTTDVACAATCLFDECAIPPNAPHVATVSAGSAPTIVPLSAIHITGTNLGTSDRLTRVTIGGIDAQVVATDSSDTLEVIVPPGLPPGPADVVVFDGEVAGPASTITVSAPVRLGDPDTFEGTLDLVDTVLGLILAFDLDSLFGPNASMLRESLQKFRTDLTSQRAALAADPNLTAAVRAHLDAVFDSSGAPDMLRASISELEDLLVPSAAQRFRPFVVNPTLAIAAIARNANTLRVVGGIATAATAPISLPAAAGIALLLGIATGVMIHFASGMPTAPVISDIVSILDADQKLSDAPIPGGFLRVAINTPNPGSTVLGLLETRGSRTVAAISNDFANQFLFPLPDPATGDFCGHVQLIAIDTSTHLGSPPLEIIVRPLLRGINPRSEGYIGERLELDTSGVLGCLDRAKAEFKPVSANVPTSYIRVMGDSRVYLPVPDIQMASYGVTVGVEPLYSNNGDDFLFGVLELLAPNISCRTTKLAVPPTDPAVPPMDPLSTTCMAKPNPGKVPFPQGTSIIWQSSDHNVGTLTPATATAMSPESPFGTRFDGLHPGTATVTATYSHKEFMATTDAGITITVIDESPPQLMLTSSPAPGMVDLGGTITVTASAHDNVALSGISIMAAGDAVSGDASQSFSCAGNDPDCSTDFTFTLKTSDFMNKQITITATATDRAGLMATSDPLSFTVSKDVTCPVVTIQSPADGATVNGGDTGQVSALVTDNAQDDTGVKRVVVDVTGDALVGAVHSDVTLPKALPSVTRLVPFTVKKAEDLVSVMDKTIIVSVEGIDDAQNTCLAQTISLTAVAMLAQCDGGISTDNPSDCDGKPFTITVALAGAGADKVTRVTSINPGGQFDLAPQGGGVYTVTLFYQGEGSFTLTFYAFDADGKGLCSNSIGLAATGPCADSGNGGAVARPVAGAPAGATDRPH